MSPMRSPSVTVNETSSNNGTAPNCLHRPCALMIGGTFAEYQHYVIGIIAPTYGTANRNSSGTVSRGCPDWGRWNGRSLQSPRYAARSHCCDQGIAGARI